MNQNNKDTQNQSNTSKPVQQQQSQDNINQRDRNSQMGSDPSRRPQTKQRDHQSDQAQQGDSSRND